jgi:ribosomal protein L11 methyltransferase
LTLGASTPALDLRWAPGVDAEVLRELLYAALDDFAPIAFHDNEAEDGLRVFFKDGAARDRAAEALKEAFADRLVELRSADVPDEDWARRSQAHLHAVRVGRIVVAPPWDVPSSDPAAFDVTRKSPIVILIDPSTGFGTGHHETTRLCLALLQEIDVVAGRVVDVGTGSGVLAIAAARLGAGHVVAIDDDADALANAAENLARNNVDAIVALVHADIARSTLEPGQVVTANLTGAVLQRYAPQIRALVADGGSLIVSGFSPDESTEVVDTFGAIVEREVREGEWAAACLRFPEERS